MKDTTQIVTQFLHICGTGKYDIQLHDSNTLLVNSGVYLNIVHIPCCPL